MSSEPKDPKEPAGKGKSVATDGPDEEGADTLVMEIDPEKLAEMYGDPTGVTAAVKGDGASAPSGEEQGDDDDEDAFADTVALEIDPVALAAQYGDPTGLEAGADEPEDATDDGDEDAFAETMALEIDPVALAAQYGDPTGTSSGLAGQGDGDEEPFMLTEEEHGLDDEDEGESTLMLEIDPVLLAAQYGDPTGMAAGEASDEEPLIDEGELDEVIASALSEFDSEPFVLELTPDLEAPAEQEGDEQTVMLEVTLEEGEHPGDDFDVDVHIDLEAAADETVMLDADTIEETAVAQPAAEEIVLLDVAATEEPADAQPAADETVLLDTAAAADQAGEDEELTRTLEVDVDDNDEEADVGETVMLSVDEEEEEDEGFGETVMLSVDEEEEDEGFGETVMLSVDEAEDEGVGETVMLSIDDDDEEEDEVFVPTVSMDQKKRVRSAFDEVESVLPEIGEVVIDRYEIVGEIGRGGFATVFEAIDKNVDSRVAMKVLHAEKSFDTEMAERFRQEVTLVRQLRHPNTIKITDAGTTASGCLFMVAEFLEGEDLDAFLKREAPLSPKRAVHVTQQILGSLAEAHDRGIVHRDLKPGNVIIGSVGGEDDYCKVLDFGIAKALGPDLGSVHTKTGFVFCTPQYAPPEILMAREVKPAADIYSVGLMLYEMLAGTKAVPTESEAAAIAFQISDDPVALPPELAGTPLGQILAKSVEKDIGDRYEDAIAMLADLKQLDSTQLTDAPLKLSQMETVILGTQFERGTTLKKSPEAAKTAPMVAASRPERSNLPMYLIVGAIVLVLLGLIVFSDLVRGRNGPASEGGETAEGPVAAVEETAEAEQEAIQEVRLSTRELLEARFAASDWQSGSWLEDELPALDLTGSLAARSFLYDSAEANQAAIDMLESAMEEGQIGEDEREIAASELIYRTANMVNAVAALDRCEDAARRLDSALETVGTVPQADQAQVVTMRASIDHCRSRVAQRVWDPSRYIASLREADRLDEQAAALAGTDERQHRALLNRSVEERRRAIAMLEEALDDNRLEPDQQENARRDMADQNQHIMATLMALDDRDAMGEQIADMLTEETLSEEERAELLALQDAFEEEEAERRREAQAAAARAEAEAEAEQQLAEVEPMDEGTGEGTGAGEGTGEEAVMVAVMDWEAYNALVSRGEQLLDQARQADVTLALFEPDKPEDGATILEGTGALLPGEELGTEEVEVAAAVVYSTSLRLTTEPRGVRLYMDGRFIGRTPFEGQIESESQNVSIQLRKSDFVTARVDVDLGVERVERHVAMEPETVFGRTHRMGGQD